MTDSTTFIKRPSILAGTFAAFFQRKKYFMVAKEPASLQPEYKKFLKMPHRTTNKKKKIGGLLRLDTVDTDMSDRKALAITAYLRLWREMWVNQQ